MTTLKGVFPDPKPVRRKNFIQENMRNLRRIEQCFHSSKEVEELHKLQLHRRQRSSDKYQNVSARINTSNRERKQEKNIADADADNKADANVNKPDDNRRLCRKSSAPVLNKNCLTKKTANFSANGNVKQRKREKKDFSKTTQNLHGKFSSDPNVSQKEIEDSEMQSKHKTKYKSQGIQTLDTNQIDDLYSEGLIRYPSKKCLKHSGIKDSSDKTDGLKETINPADRGDVQTPERTCQNGTSESPEPNVVSEPVKGEVDFIKLNKERTSAASRMSAQSNNNNAAPPSNYRKGVVPKYIKDRKEAHEKEQKAKAEAFDPDCPDGHVPLPDNERKETLRMLKKNYQDYVNELNKLPIKTDTLRAQRKKIEIEKQLNKLEEGIKVFSRPKVYVKVNA